MITIISENIQEYFACTGKIAIVKEQVFLEIWTELGAWKLVWNLRKQIKLEIFNQRLHSSVFKLLWNKTCSQVHNRLDAWSNSLKSLYKSARLNSICGAGW